MSNISQVSERQTQLLRVVIPIVLLVGGLILLAMKTPGWSAIFGLPMLVLGTVFLIYEYDNVVSTKIILRQETALCTICGRMTIQKKGIKKEKVLCPYCEWDIKQGRKSNPINTK